VWQIWRARETTAKRVNLKKKRKIWILKKKRRKYLIRRGSTHSKNVNTDAILPFVTSQISLWGGKRKKNGFGGRRGDGGRGLSMHRLLVAFEPRQTSKNPLLLLTLTHANIYIYTYTHTYMYIRMHRLVCITLCIYVCTHYLLHLSRNSAYTHTHTPVCIYVCLDYYILHNEYTYTYITWCIWIATGSGKSFSACFSTCTCTKNMYMWETQTVHTCGMTRSCVWHVTQCKYSSAPFPQLFARVRDGVFVE